MPLAHLEPRLALRRAPGARSLQPKEEMECHPQRAAPKLQRKKRERAPSERTPPKKQEERSFVNV